MWMEKVLQPLNEKAASIIAEHIGGSCMTALGRLYRLLLTVFVHKSWVLLFNAVGAAGAHSPLRCLSNIMTPLH
jgi:hypothetical protein